MRDDRIPELDALRGVAIVAVVGLHVSFGFLIAAPPASAAFSNVLSVHLLNALGTPLFVALSMAGLTLGDARTSRRDDYGTFLARRIRRIVPAYLFWTILTLLRSDPSALVQPGVLAAHVLTGSAAYHLYFVPLICTYYLLWPLLVRLATVAHRGAETAAAIVAGGIVAMLAVWQIGSAGFVSHGPLTLPLFWVGYATLGIAAAPAVAERFTTRPRWRPSWIPAALLSLVTAVVWVRHVRAMLGPAPDVPTIALATTIFQRRALVYTLSAMALATALVGGPARGTALLQALGRASYGVYLAHVLVLEVVVYRLLGHPHATDFSSPTWIAALLLQWAATLGLAYALVVAMARVPGLVIVAGIRADRALTPPARAP
jgi:peptidoglycan/LPS O-acetylase OafA/YrhL